jgi:hypothetical protein
LSNTTKTPKHHKTSKHHKNCHFRISTHFCSKFTPQKQIIILTNLYEQIVQKFSFLSTTNAHKYDKLQIHKTPKTSQNLQKLVITAFSLILVLKFGPNNLHTVYILTQVNLRHFNSLKFNKCTSIESNTNPQIPKNISKNEIRKLHFSSIFTQF